MGLDSRQLEFLKVLRTQFNSTIDAILESGEQGNHESGEELAKLCTLARPMFGDTWSEVYRIIYEVLVCSNKSECGPS